MKFLTLAALLSSASATILLQIGTKADSSAVYDAVDTVGNLSVIPRDLVDMRAIDGAVKISSFSLYMDSRHNRYHGYDDLNDDFRYSSNIEKSADAGTIVFMSHLATGESIPLLTVVDVKSEDFTIYTLRNLTVNSANLNIYDSRRYGDDEMMSTDYIQLTFDSVEVVDGSQSRVGKSHTFTKPVKDSRQKKHRPMPAKDHHKSLEWVDDVPEIVIDVDEVVY